MPPRGRPQTFVPSPYPRYPPDPNYPRYPPDPNYQPQDFRPPLHPTLRPQQAALAHADPHYFDQYTPISTDPLHMTSEVTKDNIY